MIGAEPKSRGGASARCLMGCGGSEAVAQFTPSVHGAFGFVIQSVARSAKRGISVARRRIHFALNGLWNSLFTAAFEAAVKPRIPHRPLPGGDFIHDPGYLPLWPRFGLAAL